MKVASLFSGAGGLDIGLHQVSTSQWTGWAVAGGQQGGPGRWVGFARPLLLHPPVPCSCCMGRLAGGPSRRQQQPKLCTQGRAAPVPLRCRATAHMPDRHLDASLLSPSPSHLAQAGHELLLLCESDAGARQVLRQAFPGVRIHEDVTSLERLPEVGRDDGVGWSMMHM